MEKTIEFAAVNIKLKEEKKMKKHMKASKCDKQVDNECCNELLNT